MWCKVEILASSLVGLDKCLNVYFDARVDLTRDNSDFPVVGIFGADLLKLEDINKDFFISSKMYYFRSEDVVIKELDL